MKESDRRRFLRKIFTLTASAGVAGLLLDRLPGKSVIQPVEAASMTIDAVNTGTGTTTLNSGGNPALTATNTGNGAALQGTCSVGTGVMGATTGSTNSGTGVQGVASGAGGTALAGFAGNPGAIPIVAQGDTGQTANLQEWRTSAGKVSSVNPDGSLTLGSSSLFPVTPMAAFGQQGAWERDTSDGNGFQFSWVKTRGGAACQANDSIGDLAFDFMNTTPTLVQGAVQRGIVTNPTAGSESTGFQFYCMNSGSMGLRVQITSNGNVLASGFVNTSDMRFKEDIQPIDNALDKITRLNGVYFKWNEEYRERLKRSDSQTRQVGLVAQQVREVIPEIVAKMGDSEAGDYLAVDYSRLVAIMIEATKEQQREIQTLRAEIKRLDKTVKRLAAS